MPELPPLRPADAIVVLGNRPPVDALGRPRPEVRRRVDAGVALHRMGLAPRLLMTGGKSGGYVEAEVMRDVALELGAPPAAILLEGASQSTITNARNSIRLLRRTMGKSAVSVIVVSSPFHLERARGLFECAGADVQIAASGAPPSPIYAIGFTAYEWIMRAVYLFFDECKRARGEPERRSFSGILEPPRR